MIVRIYLGLSNGTFASCSVGPSGFVLLKMGLWWAPASAWTFGLFALYV